MDIDTLIKDEMFNASYNYGPFHSTHEAYAVLLEEVQEFWELVMMKDGKASKEDMIKELIQIAAVANRTAIELSKDKIKHS